jgi:outer membrane receptor protein involved in Fe transport
MAQSAMAGAQTVLEEITVTATKREESVQDVSISMTAPSGPLLLR